MTLLEKDGWSFFSDGRINTFISFGFGDDFPVPNPNPGGPPHSVVGAGALGAAGQKTEQGDAQNNYLAMRGRNGFVGSVLGFGVRRNLTPSTTVKGFVGLWGHAEAYKRSRVQSQFSYIDVREGYVTFDGPWGNLTAGRQLGLFGRTSTEIDFLYGHNYGLGYPCGDDQGPTCGHIGTGVMFPGFAAGFMYSTPSFGGLKVHLGLYDPVRLLGAWNRAPIARPEAATTFEKKFSESFLLKVGVEGMVQPLGRVKTLDTGEQQDFTETVWGVAGGARIEAGPVRFGAAAFRGKGLGQYYALQNSPVVIQPATYEIRSFTGLYAQAAVVLGKVQLSAGAGRASIDLLDSDKTDIGLSNAKGQTGISAALYYSVSDSVVLGLDYFRFQTDWYGAPKATYIDPAMPDAGVTLQPGAFVTPEIQVVNYLNAGATYHW